MSTERIQVYRDGLPILENSFSERLLIGRRDVEAGDPAPGEMTSGPDPKYIIAAPQENTVSRAQLLIERVAEGKYRLTNRSNAVPIRVEADRVASPSPIDTRQTDVHDVVITDHNPIDVTAPLVVSFGPRTEAGRAEWAIRVEPSGEVVRRSITSDAPALAPGQIRASHRTIADVVHFAKDTVDPTELARCLLDMMPAFQNAASATEFMQCAADALVKTVGLDFAAALTWDGEWNIVATCGTTNTKPSLRILNQVHAEKRAVREVPSIYESPSLENVESLVAAPLLDAEGSIVGAVYGDRRYSFEKPTISDLEGIFVELIASGAATGLARLKQQQAAIRERARFEDFFGPALANELEQDPHLLEGRVTDVTVLFGDIRGFCGIADNLDVRTTLEWINEVLELLSICVHKHGGVVVDYVGDEIMAMWGAPTPCENHAQQACDAALEMHLQMSQIDQKWESILGEKTRVGIGINSGDALVGNIGSHCKYKYGPLGTTVNKASRIQGSTKLMHCGIVISDDTRRRIAPEAATRRLCQVQVINIPHPITLFELSVGEPDGWWSLVNTYENALAAFEERDFPKAVEKLGTLLVSHPKDGPTMVLLSRAVNAITAVPDESHPVWVLDKK